MIDFRLPWRVKQNRVTCAIMDVDGNYVCELVRRPDQAALIVDAVNKFGTETEKEMVKKDQD